MVYAKKKKKTSKKSRRENAAAQPAEEIVSAVDRGVNAVVAQWKPIAIGLVSIAVVLGALSIYDWVKGGKEDSAAGGLYDAELELPDPVGFSFDMAGLESDEASRDEDLRKALSEFQGVADEYDGIVGADLARLEAGHVHMQLGEYDQASESYGQAAASGSTMVKTLALNGKATALESAERYDEQQQTLRELMTVAAGPVVEYAYLDLIRAHELAGDTDGAMAVCREFEEKLPDSPLITDVQGKIRTLGGEPGELPTEAGEGAEEGTS